MNQDTQKLEFLRVNKVRNEPEAMQNTFQATLRRSGTYTPHATARDAERMRARWAELLREKARQYDSSTVSDVDHVQNITAVSGILS